MKCFEMRIVLKKQMLLIKLTVNMKCFEIGSSLTIKEDGNILTVNMKCFEMLILFQTIG